MEINYREEQIGILEYKKGRMAVPSVPGAGKTFILTNLVKKLIVEKEVEESKILILTYMNSAVSNFNIRINELLRKSGLGDKKRYEVMTIHSFASKIVKENTNKLNLASNYRMVDGNIQKVFIADAVREWRNQNEELFKSFLEKKEYNKWQISLESISHFIISNLKSNAITVRNVYSKIDKLPDDSILKICIQIYKSYQAKLENNALLDFDDILYYAYILLKENKEIREGYTKKYKYILEDEAQDSTVIQNKILNLIGVNWVKVGDFNQSIMGTFTASEPKIFENFIKKVENKKQMFTAGRSSENIIKVANEFVKWVTEDYKIKECKKALLPQYIKKVKKGEFPQNPNVENFGIKTYRKRNMDEELEFVVKMAGSYHKKNSQKSISILFPSNFMIEKCSILLEKAGLEYKTLSDISSQSIDFFETLADLVAFLDKPFSSQCLINLLKREFKNEDIKKVVEFIGKIPLENLLYPSKGDEYYIPKEIIDLEIWSSIMEYINKIKKILNFPKISLEKLLIYIGEVFNVNNEEKIIINGIGGELKSFYQLNPKWGLSDLEKELRRGKGNRFAVFAKFLYTLKGEEETEDTKITLATYHKSKGAEWDFVILTGLNNYNFPAKLTDGFRGEYYYLKEKYANPTALAKAEIGKYILGTNQNEPMKQAKIDKISEGIRLIYVGITRAKENLVLMVGEGRNFPSECFCELEKIIKRKKGE